MNKILARMTSGAALTVLLSLTACCTTEQKAAKQLDPTFDIINQSTALIAADPDLRRYHIEVDGFKGDMRLKGQVATTAQKQRAEKLVWASKGVKSVENDLEVSNPPK